MSQTDIAKRSRENYAVEQRLLKFRARATFWIRKITHRQMTGKFILYYNGKITGGIYDDRLLLTPFKSAKLLMQKPVYEEPYKGAKAMLLVEDVDNKESL